MNFYQIKKIFSYHTLKCFFLFLLFFLFFSLSPWYLAYGATKIEKSPMNSWSTNTPVSSKNLEALSEFRIGVQSLFNGLDDQAILHIEKALNYSPYNPLIHYWRAYAYYSMGYMSVALREWRNLIAANPENLELQAWSRFVQNTLVVPSALHQRSYAYLWTVSNAFVPQSKNSKGPTSVQPDGHGGFWVSYFDTNRIFHYNIDGKVIDLPLFHFGDSVQPFDLVVHDKSLYYTSYQENCVFLANFYGKNIKKFTAPLGEMIGPQYMSFDDQGNLYVSSWGTSDISKFNMDGQYLFSFGTKKADEFQGLGQPTGITCYNGNIYVLDNQHKILVEFDSSGVFQKIVASLPNITLNALKYHQGKFYFTSDTALYTYNIHTGEILQVFSSLNARYINFSFGYNSQIWLADYKNSKILEILPMVTLVSGIFPWIFRIDSSNFPTVKVNFAVTDSIGTPILGLASSNISLVEEGKKVPAHIQKQSKIGHSSFLFTNQSQYYRLFNLILQDIPQLKTIPYTYSIISSSPSVEKYSPIELKKDLHNQNQDDHQYFAYTLLNLAKTLLHTYDRRNIFYISDGHLTYNAFYKENLYNLCFFLRNNHIHFNVIKLGNSPMNWNLNYIVHFSQGKIFNSSNLNMIGNINEALNNQHIPFYTLIFHSSEISNAGMNYIPLHLQVHWNKQSGSTTLGYFPPTNSTQNQERKRKTIG